MQTPENQYSEVGRLRRITRDLIATSTLPAIWGGLQPQGIIDSLSTVFLTTLSLDLVYVRLENKDEGDFIETMCSRRHDNNASNLAAVRAAVHPFLHDAAASQPVELANPLGEGVLRIIVTRFGIASDGGVVVAGSQRADFPSERDRLLLGVGANQAAIVVQRQRAEQALLHSEKRFIDFADTAPAMLWVTEPDGSCTFLSRGWYDFTGQRRSEGLGLGWIDALHPEDQDRVRATFLEANARKVEFNCEHRVLHADGSYRWVIDTGRPRLSASGEFLGMVGNVLDITSRKQAEDELARVTAESERRKRLYETFLSNTPDIACVFDLDHRFTYANDALLATWGRRWDEASGKTCLELGYEPWHAAMHDAEIEQVKATRCPVTGEVPFTGTSGPRIYEYIFVPVLGPDGEVEAIAGTTRDITEHKRSEEEMAQLLSKEKRRADVLVSVTEAGKSLNMVQSAEGIAKVLAEEARHIIGAGYAETCLNRLHDGGCEVAATSLMDEYASRHAHPQASHRSQVMAEVCRTNRALRLEPPQSPQSHRPDGVHASALHAEGCIAVPLIGQGGKNLGMVWLSGKSEGEFSAEDEAILTQLAAIASARIENAYLNEKLREQDRRKDEFLATLAHELRNPLAPIRTGLALLKMVPSLDAAAKPRAIMERQVEHMVRLIDDLLEVSRITSGKVQLKIEHVDLRRVMESALELSRPLIEEKRHGLFVSLPREPLYLDADATRLTQVVSNLLNNAAKYTSKGGRIELSAAAEDNEAVIRVRDDGAGLSAETLPKLFELFSQVGKTLDRSQGGLGIGLALVRRLVEMHRGSVTAQSQGLGHGSTFTVRLPLATSHIDKASALQEQDTSDRPPARRILVVDDNVDAAEMIAMLLTLSGHEVSTVHNGPDALKAVDASTPEIVFLDIGLPGMSGYEVAQQLRARPGLGEVVLVALTGWGTEDDRRMARAAGFDHHLTKPVKIEALQELLTETMPAGHGRESA